MRQKFIILLSSCALISTISCSEVEEVNTQEVDHRVLHWTALDYVKSNDTYKPIVSILERLEAEAPVDIMKLNAKKIEFVTALFYDKSAHKSFLLDVIARQYLGEILRSTAPKNTVVYNAARILTAQLCHDKLLARQILEAVIEPDSGAMYMQQERATELILRIDNKQS